MLREVFFIEGVVSNLQAFSDTVGWSEGTTRPEIVGASDRGYNVLVGSTAKRPLIFTSYATHPDVYNSLLNSTAAGKHQIIFPTWQGLSARTGLIDFGPSTQEIMFKSLVDIDCGALEAVLSGQLVDALALCSGTWASLPGSNSGQHQNTIAALQGVYLAAGGIIAST